MFKRHLVLGLMCCGWLWCMCIVPGICAEPISCQLAKDGKAQISIVTVKDTSKRIQELAHTLAEKLSQILGSDFHVTQGDGSQGIVIGLPQEFPKLSFKNLWKSIGIPQREDYLLQSHDKGVYLLGATELAVEHAVWDFLHRLGYRQFFPGKVWECIPSEKNLSIAVDERQSPDYRGRRIWYGYGLWDYNAQPYAEWCRRNRATSGMDLRTGHAYEGIVRSNRKVFEEHPEWLALVDGKRRYAVTAKLCISNPELRAFIVKNALQRMARDPKADSLSMDPSDGGGWCECEKCQQMGSVSDRALTLANEVAKALNKEYGEKYVGMYAYNYHSPPPAIKAHPRVVVSVATAFIKGGMPLDDIIAGWSKHGATLGIREYYSVHPWDRDMPAKARGGRLDYLRETIPTFHQKGARFLSAESSDNWGPNGLGYYLAARMMWDVNESKHIDALVDDFLRRAFGPAHKPMREFYQQLDGSEPHLVLEDQLGRMYRALVKARSLTDSKTIHARLNHLLLYTRYADLFAQYQQSQGKERQAAFERLIRHAYRMRKTMMIHVKGLYRDLHRRDKSVSIPKDATWSVPEGKNPWKSNAPFSDSKLSQFLKEGIASNELTKLDYEPRTFSKELMTTGPLKLESVKQGTLGAGRGQQIFYTYASKPTTLELQITGGLIKHYRDRGNVRVSLWKLNQGEFIQVAEDRSVPPDGKVRTVRLPIKKAGTYRILVNDGGDLTRVHWKAGVPMVLYSSLKESMRVNGRWTLYFFVPEGTKRIGLYAQAIGKIIAPNGDTVLTLQKGPGNFYSIEVPEGCAGKLWKCQHMAGSIRLINVPPYLARSSGEMLIPENVNK